MTNFAFLRAEWPDLADEAARAEPAVCTDPLVACFAARRCLELALRWMYFDLVIIDEAHRSVYAKYGATFRWFDSLLLGLTATPKDEIERNMYRLFHLEDGVPTDSYDLTDAAKDHYLVPPKLVSVTTDFMARGINYDDRSDEEKEQWEATEWGDEDGNVPTEIAPAAINR